MASPQVTAVGIKSSHADTNLDGQPIVQIRRRSNFNIQLSIDEDETVANIRDISDVISTSIGVGVGTNFVLSYDPSADNFVFITSDENETTVPGVMQTAFVLWVVLPFTSSVNPNIVLGAMPLIFSSLLLKK